MVKNKIYKYIILEQIKSFFLILFSLSLIAWTVRSVNFLDLIVESGYSTKTYFTYSMLNLTNIVTKFIPLSFLISLLLTIIKLERQNELIVLWTSGIGKLKIANLFFRFSLVVVIIYLVFSTIVTPSSLNLSRNLIKQSELDSLSGLIKPKVFSDTFKGLTVYVDEKNNNIVKNIFIKDDANNLNNILPKDSSSQDQTIIAKRGIINENKIILENGIIYSYDKNEEIKIIEFNKTLLNLGNLDNRVIKEAKIQETSTKKIIGCLIDYYKGNLKDDVYIKNCPKNNIEIILETFSRRIGMPLYIPIISLLISFILVYKKNKKNILFNRYLFFSLSFVLLVISNLLVRYSGFSDLHFISYFIIPLVLIPTVYLCLYRSLKREFK